MSASSVIGDVTETLRELLLSEQRPAESFEVTLTSPAEETTGEDIGPKINLFLYRVVENPFAKNQEWLPVGRGRRQYPPLALNLFYMLTPFAFDRLDEHRVLGEAMRVFYDHAIVKTPRLKGALEHSNEELKIDLCALDLEELTRIWNALSEAYKLSVCYEIRIPLIDSLTEEPTGRVIEFETQYSQLDG